MHLVSPLLFALVVAAVISLSQSFGKTPTEITLLLNKGDKNWGIIIMDDQTVSQLKIEYCRRAQVQDCKNVKLSKYQNGKSTLSENTTLRKSGIHNGSDVFVIGGEPKEDSWTKAFSAASAAGKTQSEGEPKEDNWMKAFSAASAAGKTQSEGEPKEDSWTKAFSAASAAGKTQSKGEPKEDNWMKAFSAASAAVKAQSAV